MEDRGQRSGLALGPSALHMPGPARPLPHRVHLHTHQPATAHSSPTSRSGPLIHHIATTQGPSQGWGRSKGEGRSGQAHCTGRAPSLSSCSPARPPPCSGPRLQEGAWLGRCSSQQRVTSWGHWCPQAWGADISWCPDKLGQCTQSSGIFSSSPAAISFHQSSLFLWVHST